MRVAPVRCVGAMGNTHHCSTTATPQACVTKCEHVAVEYAGVLTSVFS